MPASEYSVIPSLDSDNLGTIPTYTLATFFYDSEADLKAKKKRQGLFFSACI